MDETQEMFQAMVSAIRNEDNSDNLVLVNVEIQGIPTTCICWVDMAQEGKNDVGINPMAVLVTPELFKIIEPVE